jgi:hypothetical protein
MDSKFDEIIAEIQKEAMSSLDLLTVDVMIPWLGR